MTIYRGAGSDDKIVAILRAAAQDERLSYTARGVLVAVMSRPKDWRTSGRALADASPQGRDAVLRAVGELDKFGYLHRSLRRKSNGQVMWIWEISDDPTLLRTESGIPGPGKPVAGRPGPRKPVAGRPGPGRPVAGRPGTGAPGTGKPGVLLEGETKGETPPPTPAVDVAAQRATEELVGVVGDSLAGRAPTPSPRGLRPPCRRLVGLGWTTDALDAAIDAHDWSGARGGAVVAFIKELGPPPPPGGRDGRAKRPAWCGACDEATRLATDPETGAQPRRCPVCHPVSVQL